MLGNASGSPLLVPCKDPEAKKAKEDSQKSTFLKNLNLQKKAETEKRRKIENEKMVAEHKIAKNSFPSWVHEHDSKVKARKKKKDKSYRKQKNKEIQNDETNSDHSTQTFSDKSQVYITVE